MFLKIIRRIMPITIIVGTILVAFGISQIDGATIIENRSITYGTYIWEYKYFNVYQYIKNLNYSLNNLNFNSMIPSQPILPNTPNSTWDILGWIKFIGSVVLIYVANWVIYALNWLILMPIKLTVLYPLNVILSILGLNTTNNDYIVVITELYNWSIPYIPNF